MSINNTYVLIIHDLRSGTYRHTTSTTMMHKLQLISQVKVKVLLMEPSRNIHYHALEPKTPELVYSRKYTETFGIFN